MPESVADQIITKFKDAKDLYHKLILVVGSSGTGKTAALQEVSDRHAKPIVNINMELSRKLLGLTEKQRPLHVSRIIKDIINAISEDIIIFDNIEILFDVNLKQDPLKLLKTSSRNKTIIASWNGTVDENNITYATTDHPEYRKCLINDVVIVKT